MDQTVLSQSFTDNSSNMEFEQRTWQYIPDSQNGSYNSGNITFDLSPLSGSEQMVNYSEAVLTIPLVMNISGNVAGTPTNAKLTANRLNAFAMNLKSYIHLIHSMSVQINGVTYQNLCQFANIDAHYKIIAGCSASEAQNLFPSLGYAKDDGVFSYYGDMTGANYGIGECNNSITGVVPAPTGGYGAQAVATSNNYNSGRMARCMMQAFDPTNTNYAKLVKSTTELNNENKNYCASSNSANEIVWYVLATIPLKFVSNLMANLPLMKGAKLTLQIQTNTYNNVQLSVVGGGVCGYSKNLCSVSTNGTIPFQLSPTMFTDTKYGLDVITTANTQIIASIGIAKGYKTIANTWATGQTNCRLYVPVYKLSPMTEQLLLTKAPVKHVVYNDLYSSILYNVLPDSQFTFTLPFLVAKPRYLLICPYLCSLNNGADNPNSTAVTNGVIIGSPINSPFSSAPNTCTPFIQLTNFNCMLSGQAIYQQNVNYGWQQFQTENRPSFAINGGMTVGVSSGVISELDYQNNGYNFVYVDLARHSLATDNVSKNISIMGTNSALVPIDLYVFCGYEKSFDISVLNGQIAQM